MPLNRKMRRHNMMVVENALNSKGFGTASDAVAFTILNLVAESIMKWMENKTYTYKDDTYNLSDSVGCAIYKQGVLVKMFMPTEQASYPKQYTYHKMRYVESGRVNLETALNNPTIAMLGDYTLGVYATMPYGLWVDQSLGDGGSNKRGKGWFSGSNGLEQFAKNEFIRIRDEYIGAQQHIG